MNEHDFDTTIDGYVETDPREYIKAGRKRIDDGERADIPEPTFEMIARLPRQRLATMAEQPVKRRDYARLEVLLAEYKSELRASIALERHAGALKPWNVADALGPWFAALDKFGWRGCEKKPIEGMLEYGEQVTAVDFRVVTTTLKSITRESVRLWALGQRPKWLVELPGTMLASEYLARAGFPTDEDVAKLERMADHIERQQHVRTSGPAHMIGKEFR